jgi:uncharacterized Fe-S cluster protein YjdI
MEKTKEYSNGDVTVVWNAGVCIHAGKCARGLPGVFNPKERPWIQVNNSSTNEIKAVIDTCPSGALSYYDSKGGAKVISTIEPDLIKVEVIEDGPLMVFGNVQLTHSDGKKEIKKRSAAFCRCGNTKNSPLCDGSHNNPE